MTLSQFVESGSVGTRDERARFEQGLLEGWADAEEHGLGSPLIYKDADPELWVLMFKFSSLMVHPHRWPLFGSLPGDPPLAPPRRRDET